MFCLSHIMYDHISSMFCAFRLRTFPNRYVKLCSIPSAKVYPYKETNSYKRFPAKQN